MLFGALDRCKVLDMFLYMAKVFYITLYLIMFISSSSGRRQPYHRLDRLDLRFPLRPFPPHLHFQPHLRFQTWQGADSA